MLSNFTVSPETVNTKENFWNVYCFATNQKRYETAKDNCQTAAWISHDLIRNSKLAFSSNELAFLQRLTFRNQTTEFGIDLEAKFTALQVVLLRYKKYGSKITNHSQLEWPFELHVKHTGEPRFWFVMGEKASPLFWIEW